MGAESPLPRCGNCLFWSGLYDHGDGQLTGDCRRHAPVCGGTSERTYTAWPITTADQFCGDWEDETDGPSIMDATPPPPVVDLMGALRTSLENAERQEVADGR